MVSILQAFTAGVCIALPFTVIVIAAFVVAVDVVRYLDSLSR